LAYQTYCDQVPPASRQKKMDFNEQDQPRSVHDQA
jgi:hypothetical protein